MKLKYLLLALVCMFTCATQQAYGADQQTKYKTHVVSKGETIYSIAAAYNVLVQDIYDINPDTKKGIRTNQVIRIPAETTASVQPASDYVLHSIQVKETLYSVSKKYNVSIEDILTENPGLSAENFRIGTAIRIPKHSEHKNNTENTVIVDKNYITHKVGGKETLHGLSKKYNISMQEIADANPEIKDSGLKKDMNLRIPLTSSPHNINTAQTYPMQESAGDNQQASNKSTKMQIGLLLPFLSDQDYMQTRFVEYYEGFLLAVEDIKKKGYSADIYAFDIRKGNDTKKLQSLLETSEIKNLDLIIGGVTDEEVALLSHFAEINNIKYVAPFPVKNSAIIAGYNTYLANLPQAELYSKVADKFTGLNKNNNIIIVSEKEPNNDKADFIVNLRERLSKDYIESKTIQVANLSTEIKDAVSLSKKNIIVPSSSSLISLSKIIPVLRNMKIQYPAIEIGMFGYPDWQAYYSQFLPDFYNYDTYIYTPFYADNNDERVKEFHQRFRKWYNKVLINTYPKYGLLGYDTGIYFLTAMAESTGSFEKNTTLMKKSLTIQSTFYFEKTEEQKGYVNTGLFFIHYDLVTTTIEKIDHSK